MREPRWMGGKATKPGYGDPEPLRAVSTMDSPENVETCLNCPLPRCCTGSTACPLWGKGPAGKNQQEIRSKIAERDVIIRELINAGWKNQAICEKLKIGKWALKEAKRRIRGGESREQATIPLVGLYKVDHT